MEQFSYWQKQDSGKAIFPDIEWQKPEQKSLAGKLLIIGGNSGGFAAVAQAYQDAIKAGIGECRAILTDNFKSIVGAAIPDCIFVPTNPSGGINKDSLPQLKAAVAWADGVLYIGDAGRNSETAIIYEQLMSLFPDKITFVTRDAIDLIKSNWPALLDNPQASLIVTFAQLQKLFQAVYYPKTLLFSMPLTSVIDTLHKFTVTYPATIVLFHSNQLIAAQNGQITTTPYDQPMLIWRGTTAARAAVYAVQHPKNQLQAITTSFIA